MPRPRVRRDLSDHARANIQARQESLRLNLNYLTGETEITDGATLATKAALVAYQAVLIELDCVGEAYYPAAVMPHESAAQSHRRSKQERDDQLDSLRPAGTTKVSSGGAVYMIEPGRFPAYDRVMELEEEFGLSVPAGELPFGDLVALAEQALTYDAEY